MNGGVYFTWAQNDPAKMLEAVQRSIARKVDIAKRHAFDNLKVWLLVSSAVPEMGAVGSTSVISSWLSDAALNSATLSLLENSKYQRAFLHIVLDAEHALYEWSPGTSWVKTVQQGSPEMPGPNWFDVRDDPIYEEFWKDPHEAQARIVREIFKDWN